MAPESSAGNWLPSVHEMLEECSDSDLQMVLNCSRKIIRDTFENGPFTKEGMQVIKDLGEVVHKTLLEERKRSFTGSLYPFEP